MGQKLGMSGSPKVKRKILKPVPECQSHLEWMPLVTSPQFDMFFPCKRTTSNNQNFLSVHIHSQSFKLNKIPCASVVHSIKRNTQKNSFSSFSPFIEEKQTLSWCECASKGSLRLKNDVINDRLCSPYKPVFRVERCKTVNELSFDILATLRCKSVRY